MLGFKNSSKPLGKLLSSPDSLAFPAISNCPTLGGEISEVLVAPTKCGLRPVFFVFFQRLQSSEKRNEVLESTLNGS